MSQNLNINIAAECGNPYISQLKEALGELPGVQKVNNSLCDFWCPDHKTTVVHIHWPEALFDWEPPKPWKLMLLEEKIAAWAERALIVTTVHNYKPHKIANWKKLYETVYSYSDAFIHLGNASKRYLLEAYPFTQSRVHKVIPHGNYRCFLNPEAESSPRQTLGYRERDFVVLCFGELRHKAEVELLVSGFDHLKVSRKRLLIASRIPHYGRRELLRWRLHLDPRIQVVDQWIPDNEVHLYLHASDILVIPREDVLNSGNVALGFTFGRQVVGPDEGVIGETLCETGNPVYEPGNPQALAEALETARDSDESIGERNKAYAMEEMSWERVASRHIKLYRQIID